MKPIFTILFFTVIQANATVYYVANAGSDAANGTSTSTPWQHLSKVNSSSFAAGDNVLLNRGDSWNERLNFPSSGTIGNVITIGSYGTGAAPVITGFQTQTGFTTAGGNIWSATASNSVTNQNTVLIDGIIRAKARIPNTGYYTYIPGSSTTQLFTSLTGTPDYTGAECVVRDTHWILTVPKITSQSGGTLNLSPALQYSPNIGGNGFFLQNTTLALDTLGEWVYNSGTKLLSVYATSSPNVQISTLDTLVYIHNKNYITFDGISFKGANKNAIVIDTARYVTIQNCSTNFSGAFGIFGRHAPHTLLENDSVLNSLSNGIYLADLQGILDPCDSSVIDNCYIKNTGALAGMGLTLNAYFGIFTIGDSVKVTNNRIDSTGYIGHQFYGKNTFVYHNYFSNFCFLKDDGGAIYTVVSTLANNIDSGSVIRGNVTVNGIGAFAGTVAQDKVAAGIYPDDSSNNILIDSNTIYNCWLSNVLLHYNHKINYRYNTSVDSIGSACWMLYDNPNQSMTLRHNIQYCKNTVNANFYILPVDMAESIDSNCYLQPLSLLLRMSGTLYNTLPAWTTATTYDANGTSYPSGITAALPLFIYNPNKSDSATTFTGTWIDKDSKAYLNGITLHPFTSVLLFKATTDYVITGKTNKLNYLKLN